MIRQRGIEDWVAEPHATPSFSIDVSMNHHEEKERHSYLVRRYKRVLGYCAIMMFIGACALVGNKGDNAIPAPSALYAQGMEKLSSSSVSSSPPAAAAVTAAEPEPVVPKPAEPEVPVQPKEPEAVTTTTTTITEDKCKMQWRPDSLHGQCFGLSPVEELKDGKAKEGIKTAEECRSFCCDLGEDCVTWQFHPVTKQCRIGGPVRLGLEVSSLHEDYTML